MSFRQSIFRLGSRRYFSTNGSHSDFARVVKKASTVPIQDRIAEQVGESKVVLYMKGVPSSPQCGFSWRTVQVLNTLGVGYRGVNVLVDDELREGIKQFGGWPTIPQLYIDGEFVGGCDIVEAMARSGDLKRLLIEKGAIEQPENE